MAHIRSLAIVLVSSALIPMLPAQREDRILKAKIGQASLSYGVLRVGTHGLHELRVGTTWRMGQGGASLMITHLPLVSGEVIIAPGSYQAQIYRAAERDLRLSLGGGRGGGNRGRGGGNRGGGTGGTGTGGTTGTGGDRGGFGGDRGSNNQLKGEITVTKKPTKKLSIRWVKADKDTANLEGTVATALQIDFGKHGLNVPMYVVQASSKNVKSFRALAFTYPESVFKAGLERGMVATIALLRRTKAKKGEPLVGFNIMVGSDSAEVVTLPTATAASGGRGGRGGRGGATVPVAAPLVGSVVWSPAQQTTESKTIKIEALKVVKKMIEFQILTGDQVGRVSVPLPKLPKK